MSLPTHDPRGGFRWTRAQRRRLMPGAKVAGVMNGRLVECEVESHDPETTWDPKRDLLEPTGLGVFFPGDDKNGDGCLCDLGDFDPKTLVPSPHAPNKRETQLAGGRMEIAVLLAKYRIELQAAANSCEACGDCLLPEPPRCERHVHTEPGDDEWTMPEVTR